MKMKRMPLPYLVQAAVIAAIYAALTLLLAPISYGAIQCRVAEVLTILPVFTPAAIPGLAVGCFISNLNIGADPAGALDLLFGPLATLCAAILTRWLRKYKIKGLPVLSALPPVIFNALVVGAELTLMTQSTLPFEVNALYVGAGEFIACMIGGVILYTALVRTGAGKRLFIIT